MSRRPARFTEVDVKTVSSRHLLKPREAAEPHPSIHLPSELAERWGCSERHVRDLCRKKKLPHFQIGANTFRVVLDTVPESAPLREENPPKIQPGGPRAELHRQFAADRLEGEWFRYSDAIRVWIEAQRG